MEVTSEKSFFTHYLSFWSYCIADLGPFHLRNALSNALSDAFLIITQVLLMIFGTQIVFELENSKIHQNEVFHRCFAFK